MKLNRTGLLIGAFLTLASLAAFAAGNEPQVFSFSAGWRDDGARPENVLQLGAVYPCPGGWCAEVEEFHGAHNLQRRKLGYRHAMHVSSGATTCTDEYLTTIRGQRSVIRDVDVEKDGDGYLIKVGGLRFAWGNDVRSQGGYVLRDVTKLLSQVHESQPVGYAYWSENISGVNFRSEQFAAYFDGEIAHKDMVTDVGADWSVTRSTFHLERFVARDPSSPVLSLTQDGQPDVIKRIRKVVRVENSVLPPADVAGSGGHLRYFHHEYGHDFNGNGCFDEFGHNKLMLPVLRNNMVSAFVYVEYTPDNRDGVPMLSVGRYFRQR